jgi:Zn-dependent M28 family amino/carboxypeptidase
MKTFFRVVLAAVAAGVGIAQTVSLFQQVGERLSANGLKADVSFLASDALEGRGTPSKGLDIAAEYIAAQFRRAALEPAGDDGYFQTAQFATVTPNAEGLEFSLEAGGQTLRADKAALSVQEGAALDLSHAAAFKVSATDFAALTPETVKGKVLLVEAADGTAGGRGGSRRLLSAAAKAQAALVVMVRASVPAPAAGGNPQLRDMASPVAVPVLTVTDAAIRAAVAASKPGPVESTVSVHMAAPTVAPVKLRNVVGLLRGSDPALKETFLVLTAHYDHLGIRGTGEGDHIYNGANDDASGTASVIEIAGTLGGLAGRPRRSILFMALFGEERGELGSRYYAQHPIFPLAKTIADVNLEQLGRTDESGEARKIGQFNLTGFDFTDLAATFRQCAEPAGVQVVKDETRSDAYFGRSDNAPFADVGVPSTTLSVTYEFSDYHAAGDEWPKLDYENMAKVDRAIALAVYRLADSTEEPRWNAENPRTEAYRKARGK